MQFHITLLDNNTKETRVIPVTANDLEQAAKIANRYCADGKYTTIAIEEKE